MTHVLTCLLLVFLPPLTHASLVLLLPTYLMRYRSHRRCSSVHVTHMLLGVDDSEVGYRTHADSPCHRFSAKRSN